MDKCPFCGAEEHEQVFKYICGTPFHLNKNRVKQTLECKDREITRLKALVREMGEYLLRCKNYVECCWLANPEWYANEIKPILSRPEVRAILEEK